MGLQKLKAFLHNVLHQEKSLIQINTNYVNANIDSILDFLINSSPMRNHIIIEDINTLDEYLKISKKYMDIFETDKIISTLLGSVNFHGDYYYRYSGYCDACKSKTNFFIETMWKKNTEGIGCLKCGLNSRMRNMFYFIDQYYRPGMNVYISEQVTSFYKILKNRIPNLIGSEYDPSGTLTGIMHQDITDFDFPDKSFDMYISNDVLEHVFDYKKAISESYRILSNNGILILHVPLHEMNDIVVRSIMKDNKLYHIKTPIYHGNPLSGDGSLCVTDFGWDILKEIRSTGFKNVKIIMRRDIEKGIHGNNILTIIAKKGD